MWHDLATNAYRIVSRASDERELSVPFWSGPTCQDFVHTFQWGGQQMCGEHLAEDTEYMSTTRWGRWHKIEMPRFVWPEKHFSAKQWYWNLWCNIKTYKNCICTQALNCLYIQKMLRCTRREQGHIMSLCTDLNTRKSMIHECCDSCSMQVSAHYI